MSHDGVTVLQRVNSSFARLKEVLGFGGEVKNRTFPLQGELLKEMRLHVQDNVVTSSKYNWFTFLPINIFQQFTKAANVYFLLITVM